MIYFIFFPLKIWIVVFVSVAFYHVFNNVLVSLLSVEEKKDVPSPC